MDTENMHEALSLLFSAGLFLTILGWHVLAFVSYAQTYKLAVLKDNREIKNKPATVNGIQNLLRWITRYTRRKEAPDDEDDHSFFSLTIYLKRIRGGTLCTNILYSNCVTLHS